MNDNYALDLLGYLDQSKSKKQINADIKQLEKTINMLRLTATFAKTDTKKGLNNYIKQLSNQLSTIKLKAKIDSKNLKSEVDKALNNVSFRDIDALNIDGNKTKLKVQKVIADTKTFVEKNPIVVGINISSKKNKLDNDLTTYLNKNTKINESSVLLEEANKVRDLIDAVTDKKSLTEATDAFRLFKSEVSATGYTSKSTADKVKSMLGHITKIGSAFGVASMFINNFTKSLETLRSNDTILTEISKTSEMTKNQLKELGDEAFKIASKYGQLSSNFLLATQEMARAGYDDNVKDMAELSTKVQGAGDMTAELSNQYIIATDKAFKMNGSIETLTTALDGANNITNNNALAMSDLAEAMSIVGSQAASSGMKVNETTAAVSTMIAVTQRSGSEAANAFKGILMNLQQVTGEIDGEEIDTESLTKYEKACAELGVSLSTVKDGIVSLKEPMQIIKELSEVYTQLDESDARRANLLSAVGGKYRANMFNAILENYDLYEKMLKEYADGLGSMDAEAEKTANSWEGRLNALSNSFTSFVNVLTNKEAVLNGISFFDRLIQGAESFIDTFGTIPTILTAINSFMVATKKDYGITKVWDRETQKIDFEGSIFGIDISKIKNLKKHYQEAEEAIQLWNDTMSNGENGLVSFNSSIVSNNASLKEYLSTCSKDAPASLQNYKDYLQQTGQATEMLRLKTILLNTALTMIGSLAVQAVITGLYNLSQVSSNIANNAKELGESFKSTSSDIESYKSKIEELYSTINDSNSSIEDVTNARKTLMSVQDELIDKFGTEKGVINDVTDAINGQTEALDRLTNSKWQETKNEFNDGGFWNDAANFFEGKDNIQRMLDEYGEKTISFKWADYANINKLTDDMVAKLENIGIDIKVSTDNLQATRDFDSLTESIEDTKGASLSLSGNAEEIYNKLLALQNLIGNDDSFDKLYEKIGNTANSYKELTDKYKDFYDQYILQEKIFSDDSNYADTFKKITDAAEKYNEAFTSGDEAKIKEAADEYADIVSSAMDTAIANGDSDVATYFENMYPTLKTIVSGWQFNIAFDANTDDLQGKVQTVLDELKDENGRSLTAEEILGLGEANKQYQDLVAIANSYNMSIEEMIELLKERNLVSAMDYQGLVNLFGQENVDELSPEDLEIAYTIENASDMTFEELQAEIQRLKELNETPVSLTISQTVDQLNTQIKPAMDALASAYQNIFDDKGKFQSSTIDVLSTCDTIKSKLDEMSKIGIKVDDSAYEDFVSVLSDSKSTEQDVEQAFDSLSTAITRAAVSGTEDFETLKASLAGLGVENSAMAAFDALTNNMGLFEEKIEQAGLAMQDFVDANNDGSNSASTAAQSFLEEMVGADNCGQALALLQLKQIAINQSTITTADDCQNILALAQTANVGIAYLEQLNTLMNLITKRDAAHASGDSRAVSELNRAIHDFSANLLNNLQVDDIEIPWQNLGKAAGKAGKDAGKSYKDALKEELSDIESVISGVTGRIDDQISSINEQKSVALDAIDAEKEALEDAKDAAISALEEERQKRLDVIEAQRKQIQANIDAKQKIIDDINAEIKAMQDANEERQRELDLQKAKYELERMQNQRTKLVYSSDKGMHYESDTKGIADSREQVRQIELEIEIANKEKEIDLIQKEIDKLNEKLDLLDVQENAINDYYDKLISETEAFYNTQLKNLEKQRKETESYFESITKNLENQKSKFQELTELLEKAELSAKLKQLGIDEEALLAGSEEEFNKLKEAYLNIVYQLNAGNDDVLSKLRDLSGYEGTAPTVLSDSNTELDEMNTKLGTSNTNVGNVNSSLDKTASTTSTVASNVGEISSNISESTGLVSEEQAAFSNLKQIIDEVIEAISQKTQAIEAEQNAVGTATGSEMSNFELLKNKILEVKETLDTVNGTVTTMDRQPIDNLTNAFQLLYDQIVLVSNELSVNVENSIASAIQVLNNISLEEGIIAQFTNLKTAIDSVTAAISGGGSGESSGSEGQGSSGSKQGGEPSGKSSKGESSGGNSLTGAIEQMGETAITTIGEPDAEGDGTVIGEFGSMETAVNDVRDAIGTEGSGDGEGGNSGGEGDDTLVGSIEYLGDKTEEEMGESGGDGIIGRFEEFEGIIEEAANQVRSISEGLEAIDGQEVECTITVNVKMNGSIPAFASGTVLGNMQIESATYNAQYGKAFASGTIGLPHAEKNALVSEYGQTEMTVLPDGKTIITDTPTMMDLPKDTVIYNEEETKKIMDNKIDAKVAKSYANGTVTYEDGTIVTPDGKILRPLRPGDNGWDLYQAGQKLIEKWKESGEEFLSNAYFEHTKQMEKWTKEITNNTAINNITNNRNMQQPIVNHINVTCPGVTEQQVAERLGSVLDKELDKKFNGLHLDAMQQSMKR